MFLYIIFVPHYTFCEWPTLPLKWGIQSVPYFFVYKKINVRLTPTFCFSYSLPKIIFYGLWVFQWAENVGIYLFYFLVTIFIFWVCLPQYRLERVLLLPCELYHCWRLTVSSENLSLFCAKQKKSKTGNTSSLSDIA